MFTMPYHEIWHENTFRLLECIASVRPRSRNKMHCARSIVRTPMSRRRRVTRISSRSKLHVLDDIEIGGDLCVIVSVGADSAASLTMFRVGLGCLTD